MRRVRTATRDWSRRSTNCGTAERAVLALFAVGFSQSEIAVILGEPLGTVKSRMRRSFCQLRQILPSLGIDGPLAE